MSHFCPPFVLFLFFRWADLPCGMMEERERAGETLGEMGPACLQLHSKKNTCTIQPLRMNCYKLWLEVPSPLGTIRSKPVYLSPKDHGEHYLASSKHLHVRLHVRLFMILFIRFCMGTTNILLPHYSLTLVKPNTPTNVKAVSQSSGVLRVTWEPPSLPVDGLQCQFRHHSLSAIRAQPEWKVNISGLQMAFLTFSESNSYGSCRSSSNHQAVVQCLKISNVLVKCNVVYNELSFQSIPP